MGWDIFNWIFGLICIIGPICLIFWYFSAAKKQLKNLHEGD